jgi:hypothetical protein
MKNLVYMLISAVALSVACGCAQENLARYVPLGPSAEFDTLTALCLVLPTQFVYWDFPDPQARKRPEDVCRELEAAVARMVGDRPANPGFRCLLALVNRYFGEWERLIIIERIHYNTDCGFLAVAQTPEGLKAVTNLRYRFWRRDENHWESGPSARPLRISGAKFGACLEELDKCRGALPEGMIWFGSSPSDLGTLFVLHDIRHDGAAFSFGVYHFPPSVVMDEQDEPPLPKPPFGFPKNAEADVRRLESGAYSSRSPEAKECYALARKYVAVLAMVWENTLGPVDERLLSEW